MSAAVLSHTWFSDSFIPDITFFKNIFDFTTAGDWDCVAAVERLPALHYSVEFIFLSFGIMGFIWELWNYQRVTDEPLNGQNKLVWPRKLAHSCFSSSVHSLLPNDNFFNNIWAATCDFQQCGILTCVNSDEPVQPPFTLRNSKWCSVCSLTVIEYSSD